MDELAPRTPQSAAGKVAGIVVTFHPTDAFLSVLTAMVRELSVSIVVSNDPGAEERLRLDGWVRSVVGSPSSDRPPPVEVLYNGANFGLSRALNRGIQRALDLGAEFVLLLDQDSLLKLGAVDALREDHDRLARSFPVGAVSCSNDEQVTLSRFPLGVLERMREIHTEGWRRHHGLHHDSRTADEPTFMNSGTLLPTNVLRAVGGFDERLFVDATDFDLSLRLRQHGLRLFRSDAARLDHVLGAPYVLRLFGREIRLRTHSPSRSFYSVRDTALFARTQFRAFPVEVLGIVLRRLLGSAGALALLPDRRLRGRAMLEGLRSALTEPLGARTAPAPAQPPL